MKNDGKRNALGSELQRRARTAVGQRKFGGGGRGEDKTTGKAEGVTVMCSVDCGSAVAVTAVLDLHVLERLVVDGRRVRPINLNTGSN